MRDRDRRCVRCGQFIHRYDTDGDSVRGAIAAKSGEWWCHQCAVAEVERWISEFGEERAESPAPPERGEND